MSEKLSKILLYIILALIFISVTATYYKTIVQRDFEIINDLEENLTE